MVPFRQGMRGVHRRRGREKMMASPKHYIYVLHNYTIKPLATCPVAKGASAYQGAWWPLVSLAYFHVHLMDNWLFIWD